MRASQQGRRFQLSGLMQCWRVEPKASAIKGQPRPSKLNGEVLLCYTLHKLGEIKEIAHLHIEMV